MEALTELKTKLQNLLDVNGADLELVLPDAIDLVKDIEREVEELEDGEAKQDERIAELENELDNIETSPGSEVCKINSGRDMIYIRSDSGNLLDTQIIEAFKACMEYPHLKPLFFLNQLQKLSKW